MRDIVVFSGSAHRELAERMCEHLGVPLSPAAITRFSNDCLQAQLLANCRQRDVYLVQPLVPRRPLVLRRPRVLLRRGRSRLFEMARNSKSPATRALCVRAPKSG